MKYTQKHKIVLGVVGHHNILHHRLFAADRRCPGQQPTNAQVVDNLLDLLYIVLEAIEAFAQAVVLEVQQSKSGAQIGDKVRDLGGAREVALRHRVGREADLKPDH